MTFFKELSLISHPVSFVFWLGKVKLLKFLVAAFFFQRENLIFGAFIFVVI